MNLTTTFSPTGRSSIPPSHLLPISVVGTASPIPLPIVGTAPPIPIPVEGTDSPILSPTLLPLTRQWHDHTHMYHTITGFFQNI